MSLRTLPLVFINLGGEMLYILDQRLRADNTSEDKSQKGVWTENEQRRVMNDIVATMFSRFFIDELLKPQQLYSHRTMKTVLTRLAHTSIMRLNQASMDKLYDLMLMTFKYQVFLCPRPKDLLLITYNHLDGIRDLVRDTPMAVNQVDEAQRRVMEGYSSFSEGDFQILRQTLLVFFQEMNVRVSLFLKNKIQNPNGRFVLKTSGPVPHGVEVPGLIRMFDCRGREVRRREFPTGGSYGTSLKPGSFELHGARITRLGLNMYTADNAEETPTTTTASVKQADDTPNLLAKEELNLLARLMGSMKAEFSSVQGEGFRINLFNTDEDEEEEEGSASGGASQPSFGVINIQAVQDEQVATALSHIAGQFAEEKQEKPENHGDNKGEDLLAMMDDL